MQLSDTDILKSLENGEIVIENFDITRLQPASYDVLLGFEFMIFDTHRLEIIDPKVDVKKFMTKVELKSEEEFFVLHPGELALGLILDKLGPGPKHTCQIMGKSSLARLGLIVHTTAGFIDPGNVLQATLEFVNTNSVPIRLYPKMRIAQVAFYELKSAVTRPYGHKDLNNKYFASTGVQASEMWSNFPT